MTQAIPVSERMPDVGQFVIGFGPHLGTYIGGPKCEICRWDGISFWGDGGTEILDTPVTHWAPIPDHQGAL